MRFLAIKALLMVIFLTLITGTQAQAQDILSSTGSSTRRYNYVEVQFLTNVDQSNPFLVTGLVDIAYGFAFIGQFTNQREQLISDEPNLNGEASTDLFTLGVLYRNRLFRFKETDWFVEAAAGNLQLEVDTPAAQITQNILILRGSGGVRQTLTERLELELSGDVLFAEQTAVTNSSTDVTVSATAVYRLFRNFDIALSLNEVPNTNIVGVGLRVTW